MAKTRNEYVMTFSVRRLVELLTEAGFDVRPSSDLRGGLIQFVSTPAERRIVIKWTSGVDMPWEQVAGDAEVKRQKEQVEVPSGQYL